MKRGRLLLIVLLLCSCPAKSATSEAETQTPTSLPTFSTPYVIPSSTTTPTATAFPTFDPAAAITRTPETPAVCPEPDPNFEFPSWFPTEDSLGHDTALQFLRDGASMEYLASSGFFDEPIDLTGDGIAELVVTELYRMVVIGCRDNEYAVFLNWFDSGSWVLGPSVELVTDMNLNGVPEVVTTNLWHTGLAVNIFEWDGIQFASLIKGDLGEDAEETSHIARGLYWYSNWWWYSDEGSDEILSIGMEGGGNTKVRDLDGNGTLELIVHDNGGAWLWYGFGPIRPKTVTFTWDGEHFLYSTLELATPDFRYQAVQDADYYFLLGNYEKALFYYREAIFNVDLDWWTPEKMEYIYDTAYLPAEEPLPPMPPENPDERLALTAYSRYRIILHHLAHDWVTDAETVYTTLVQDNPQGTAGYPYLEMATLLLDTYRQHENLALACEPVVVYVQEHLDLLDPLGNDDEQWSQQSHYYEPIDTCPFASSIFAPPLP